LGLALRNAWREEEALEPFKLAVRARPDWAVAWKDLGLTLAILGELTLAETALQRAVALQPELGDAQRHLAGLRAGAAGAAETARLEAACADPKTPAGERVANMTPRSGILRARISCCGRSLPKPAMFSTGPG
jgi:Flp pilus assembly protein TadD